MTAIRSRCWRAAQDRLPGSTAAFRTAGCRQLVVLQKGYEGGRGQRRRGFATRSTATKRRRLALIGKAFGQGAAEMGGRLRRIIRIKAGSLRAPAGARLVMEAPGSRGYGGPDQLRLGGVRSLGPPPAGLDCQGGSRKAPLTNRGEETLPADHSSLCPNPHISTSAPSSMTRSGGMRKKSVGRVAMRARPE